jgi:hypothetical protein
MNRATPVTLLAALASAALALFVPSATHAAGLDFGVRAGAYLEDEDPFVGLELLTRLGASDWFFNPNVEFVFADERDRVSLNADFHYDFLQERQFYLWAGAGLGAIYTESGQGRDSETDLGANLLGGIGWKLSGMTPYAQLKIVLADDAEVVAGVGLRF